MNRFTRHVALVCAAVVVLAASPLADPVTTRPQKAAPAAARPAAPPTAAARYLEYARASADYAWANRAAAIDRWRASFDPDSPFGSRAPGGILETALIYAYLAEKENNATYADRARTLIVTYGDYRSAFPESAAKKRPAAAKSLTVQLFNLETDPAEAKNVASENPEKVKELEAIMKQAWRNPS